MGALGARAPVLADAVTRLTGHAVFVTYRAPVDGAALVLGHLRGAGAKEQSAQGDQQ